MNKPLSTAELAALEVPAPFAPMTRQQKFDRWEKLVREYKGKVSQPIGVENVSRFGRVLRYIGAAGASPYAIAAADSEFKAQGLTGETVAELMTFFETSDSTLHYICCSCQGEMTNDQLADRIRYVGMYG